MCLPEVAFLIFALVMLAVLNIAVGIIRGGKTYDDDTTQQFKRILEQGERRHD